MKTYTKTTTVTLSKLVIERDIYCESPRTFCDNLGYFYTKENNYRSPDGDGSDIYKIMIESADDVPSVEEHIERMTKRINKETGEKVLAIYPVTRYEHSGGVVYSVGIKKGWDYSLCGFYIITDKTQKLLDIAPKDFEKVVAQELADYTKWVNGEVYRFTLYNDDGGIEDICGGFYSLEDIRDVLGTKEDWSKEDLEDYLIN
jgi:hypothetical protein